MPSTKIERTDSASCTTTRARLSVVMPNFNDSGTIKRALESVCTQSWVPHEVIVVDDGSTDDSIEIIQTSAQRYPSIKLIALSKNTGVLAASNCGAKEAVGEVLVFASANDVVLPGFFEIGMNSLAKHPEAGLFCADMKIRGFTEGSVTEFDLRKMLPRSGYFSPIELAANLKGKFIATPTVLIRRPVFERSEFQQSLYWHADWWSFTLAAFRYGLCYEPTICAVFNSDGSGFSKSMMNPRLQREVFIEVLRSSVLNPTLIPLLTRAKAFDFLICQTRMGDPRTVFLFLREQSFSQPSIQLASHLLLERVRDEAIRTTSKMRANIKRAGSIFYYYCKGRFIDLAAISYKCYVSAYIKYKNARGRRQN